jgi:chemotaxis signal transduction protein
VTDERVGFAEQAIELGRAFDRTFAQAPSLDAGESTGFLRVRVGGDAYAFALDAIVGLFVDKTVVALPSAALEMLGIAGIRGAIVPVYSLRSLLGYTVERECPRWLVLARSPKPVGLAFEEFVGYVQARPSDLAPAPRTDSHVLGTVRAELAACAVLSIPSILETLGNRRRRSGDPLKER